MIIIFSLLMLCGFTYVWSQQTQPFKPVQETTSDIMKKERNQSEVPRPIRIAPSHKIRPRPKPSSPEIARLLKEYDDACLIQNENKAKEIGQQLRALGYEF